MRLLVSAVLVAALAAGCGGSGKTYSSDDVERAFQSQGFDLEPPPTAMSKAMSGEDLYWVPKTGEPFVVVLYAHKSDADDAVKTLRSQASATTFDVQQANVVVMSDQGVTAPVRIRINAALFQLS